MSAIEMRSLRLPTPSVAGVVMLTVAGAANGSRVVEDCTVRRVASAKSNEQAFLTGIPHAALANGLLVVPQPALQHVKLYDSSDDVAVTIGKRGEGPGEFRSPIRVGIDSDTVWVYDAGTRRVSLFTASGDFVRSYSPPLPPGSFLAARLSRGSHAGSAFERGSAPDERLQSFVLATGPDGSAQHILAVSAVAHRAVTLTGAGLQRTVTEPPWDDAPNLRAADDGSAITIVHREIAPESGASTFRVQRYSPDGTLVWDRAYSYRPRRIGSNDVDAVAGEWSASFRSVLTGRGVSLSPADFSVASIRSQLDVPRFAPPVREVLSSSDGRTWLRVVDRSHALAGNDWRVLDTAGNAMATCRFEQKVRLLAVDRGVAWAVEQDSLDVPNLVRYEVALARP